VDFLFGILVLLYSFQGGTLSSRDDERLARLTLHGWSELSSNSEFPRCTSYVGFKGRSCSYSVNPRPVTLFFTILCYFADIVSIFFFFFF